MIDLGRGQADGLVLRRERQALGPIGRERHVGGQAVGIGSRRGLQQEWVGPPVVWRQGLKRVPGWDICRGHQGSAGAPSPAMSDTPVCPHQHPPTSHPLCWASLQGWDPFQTASEEPQGLSACLRHREKNWPPSFPEGLQVPKALSLFPPASAPSTKPGQKHTLSKTPNGPHPAGAGSALRPTRTHPPHAINAELGRPSCSNNNSNAVLAPPPHFVYSELPPLSVNSLRAGRCSADCP